MRLLPISCLALVVGCGGSSSDVSTPEDTGTDTAETATEVGADADTGAPDTAVTDADAGPCDDTKAPKDAPCVLRDDLGVFVSSSLGDDANDGAKTRPLKTLAKALSTAKDKKKRVYACAEDFAEAVVAVDGVAAFGGVDCKGGWVGVSGQTTVKAPTSPAFTAKGLTVGAQFTSFSFVAPDATSAGGSSIGGFAANSKLRFDLCAFTAGTAANGANGDLGATGTNGNPGNFGEDARTLAACPDRPLGGTGGVAYSAGGDGGKTCDAAGGSGKGKNAAVNTAGTCGLGTEFDGGSGVCGTLVTGKGFLAGLDKGCPATDGGNGAAGKSLGAVTADGLGAAAAGGDGTAGTAGGGGGGGGSGLSGGSSGGGGGGAGGGGKGGGPGRGGTSGGSSIAFVSFNSDVVLDKTDLKAADGGKAGSGGSGAEGGLGGKGAEGGRPKTSPNERGCAGGDGAKGGHGGGGAGGGGGSSIGLLYVGTKPTRTAGAVTLGTASKGGAGGVGVTAAPAGEDGVAVAEKGI